MVLDTICGIAFWVCVALGWLCGLLIVVVCAIVVFGEFSVLMVLPLYFKCFFIGDGLLSLVVGDG